VTPWCAWRRAPTSDDFKPSFFPAASKRIDSRIRVTRFRSFGIAIFDEIEEFGRLRLAP
jgi:hypothetical protein